MNRRHSFSKSVVSLLIAASHLSAILASGCAVQPGDSTGNASEALMVLRVTNPQGAVVSEQRMSAQDMRSRNEQALAALFNDAPTQPEAIFAADRTTLQLSAGGSLILDRDGGTLRASTEGADVRIHAELQPSSGSEESATERMTISSNGEHFTVEAQTTAGRTFAREALAAVALTTFAYAILGPDAVQAAQAVSEQAGPAIPVVIVLVIVLGGFITHGICMERGCRSSCLMTCAATGVLSCTCEWSWLELWRMDCRCQPRANNCGAAGAQEQEADELCVEEEQVPEPPPAI